MAYTTINKSSLHMNTKLYTGNASTNAQTGVGFQPDLTWIKNRNLTGGYGHCLFDSVRGVNKRLRTHTTSAEDTLSDSFNSFNSDGFTLGGDSQTSEINKSSASQVAWNWKANGTGVSNTSGSISSTVSANTTSGFSIVKYTGTGTTGTIGHGLGVAPSMYIVKKTSALEDWEIYHKSLGATKDIRFTTGAAFSSTLWNNTEPTSAVFNVLTGQSVNNSGSTYIAYCFAEKQGYSKFGSYVGNGNLDGSFVYTGFKPAFVMIKPYTHAIGWSMIDNKRDSDNNGTGSMLKANSSSAEDDNTAYNIEFLSNGFKNRNQNSSLNNPGYGHIYMAFAEAPLVGTNNVPCTAR